uniref:Uncharacterized protein n=1 Tax=Varanus komodoensis TaxID=61221 RepID=A0A8D2Q4K2_VARKO
FFLTENQKEPREKLHLHHGINAVSAKNPVSRELNHDMGVNSSAEKKKSVGKKDVSSGGSSRGKETESASFVSRGESIPEVEALLARLRAL